MPVANKSDTKRPRALLIRNAYSFDFGGAERFVVNLAKELQVQGWDAIVLSAHKGVATYAHEQNVPFIRSPWWSRQDWSGKMTAWFPLYCLWQLYIAVWYAHILLRTGARVIHPQSRDDFIGATIAGRLLRRTVIWTDHADLKYVYQNVRVQFKNPIGKWVWRLSHKADAVTMVSRSEEHLVGKQAGQLPANYRVIHNGTLDAAHAPIPAKRTKTEQDAVIFCATSRLVTAKGIGELISAFTSLAAKSPAYLWIVGDGPESDTFTAQAKNNPRIIFKGFQPDTYPFVAACDVFVHPSYHEGFSLSLVEAAMFGKPIIACNVGGNPEIVHDTQNGLLIPPRDSQALAKAMQTLANDAALRSAYGQAARQTYLSEFEFDRIVKERFLPLYEKS